MKRINIAVTDEEFSKIVMKAKHHKLKHSTFCRYASLLAAGIRVFPELKIFLRQEKK